MKAGNTELQFVSLLQLGGPSDKPGNRAAYYRGMSDYHSARSVMSEAPDQAHDRLQRAGILFKQAQASDWSNQIDLLSQDVRLSRNCWMCGREMQGRNIFYKHYPAEIQKYHTHVVDKPKQDQKMLEQPGTLTLCTACGSAIEAQADEYATKRTQELRDEVMPILQQHGQILDQHTEAIRELANAIDSLRASAHSHH